MEIADPVPQAYLFFARAFSYPRREFYDLLASEETQGSLSAMIAGLPFRVTIDAGLRFSSPCAEIEPEYINAFDIAPACPLYEGLIRGDQTRQELFVELLRFYEYFGVQLPQDDREYPDHLCVELEFMAYLAQAERHAMASGREPRPFRLAQRDFLARHLLAWVPLLNQRIPGATKEPFYATAGVSLVDFLRQHQAYVREQLAAGGLS